MNQAFHIDAIEYMASLPENVFDLAIADPPRGDGTATRIAKKSGTVYGKLRIPKGNYPASDWDRIQLLSSFSRAFETVLSKNELPEYHANG